MGLNLNMFNFFITNVLYPKMCEDVSDMECDYFYYSKTKIAQELKLKCFLAMKSQDMMEISPDLEFCNS